MKKNNIIIAKGRGKTWFKSVEAQQRRVKDEEKYLIMRHGGWFRPEAHGYTNDLSEAGVFMGHDARGYLQTEGVSLHSLREMRREVYKMYLTYFKKSMTLFDLVKDYEP